MGVLTENTEYAPHVYQTQDSWKISPGHESWKLSPAQTVTIDDTQSDPFLVGVVDDGTRGHEEKLPEGPKVALETNFFRSLFSYGLFMHTLALGATAGIVQLSFRGTYWADDGHWQPKWFLLNLNATNTMNVLQFAAKIHEILIIASLSLIVIHVTRRMLVGRGVPLGLLTGAYQVGSAEYFISPSYLSPLLWSIRHLNLRMFILAFCTGLLIIFANMIGPSSAIAIIPNLDWYPIALPFQGFKLISYIRAGQSDIYPTTLEQTSSNCTDVLINGTVGTFMCPAGGHATLFDWALSSANEDVGLTMSMIEPLGKTRRILVANTTSNETSQSSLGMATTHSSVINALLGTFVHYINKHNIDPAAGSARPRFHVNKGPVYSPLVQAECKSYVNSSMWGGSDNMYFSYQSIRMFEKDPVTRKDIVVPSNLWNKTTHRALDSIQVAWVNSTELKAEKGGGSNDYYGSIGALITLPAAFTYINDSGQEDGWYIDSYVVSCIMDARYAASELSYDPNIDDIVTNNLTTSTPAFDYMSGDRDKGEDGKNSLGISDLVQITQPWIESLDTPQVNQYAGQENATLSTAIASLFSAYLYPLDDYAYFIPPKQNNSNTNGSALLAAVAETAASVLTLAIADGMSRSNYLDWGIFISNGTVLPTGNITVDDLLYQAQAFEEPPSDMSREELDQYTDYTFNVERYGIGYGLQNNTTQFGIAILLTHAGMVVLYLAYLVLFRFCMKGWMSEAWADLGELMTLALLSRAPDQLKHTGVGIDSWKTWRYPVRVRECAGNPNQLEMLVGKNKELHKKNEHGMGVRKKKKYS